MCQAASTFVYVGSYTVERSQGDRFVPVQAAKGIRVFCVDPESGTWNLVQEIKQLNPMYLLWGKDKKTLYAASSDSNKVYAYRVCGTTGMLSLLGEQEIVGRSTLCLSVTKDYSFLIVGTISGAMASIRLNEDGSLGEVCDNFDLPGEPGPLRDEQPCPRPHHCPFDPDGKYCYVLDKGADLVRGYTVDRESGKMEQVSILQTRPGSIPRHIVFNTDGSRAYINTEHNCTVISCRRDRITGKLEAFQILPTIPEDFVGTYSLSSEIILHPSGKWLYVSNRGHNSIAIFSVDQESGRLTTVGWQSTLGEIPRFFDIEPGGKFLCVANQKDSTIKIFRIDERTGMLSFTGRTIETPTPVWLLFSGPLLVPHSSRANSLETCR